MYVILPILPDPTDIVVQGAQTFVTVYAYGMDSASQIPMVQDDMGMLNPILYQIPADVIGLHPWFGIRSRQIGPMAWFGGTVAMLNIGPTIQTSPDVDPIQTWLYSQVPQDLTGEFVYMNDNVGASALFQADSIVAGDNGQYPSVSEPRAEILCSGLLKNTTAPVLPSDYGAHLMGLPLLSSSIRYFFTGTTRDATGAALASCNVTAVLMSPVGIGLPDYLVAATTTSAGDGTFSMLVARFGYHALISYKPGSPDVAGTTDYNITPTAK